MAIECKRLDKLEEAVLRSENVHSTINYCIDVSHSFVNRREYRQEVTSFIIICNCYPWTCPYLLKLDLPVLNNATSLERAQSVSLLCFVVLFVLCTQDWTKL